MKAALYALAILVLLFAVMISTGLALIFRGCSAAFAHAAQFEIGAQRLLLGMIEILRREGLR